MAENKKDTETVEENASVVGATPVSNDLLSRGRRSRPAPAAAPSQSAAQPQACPSTQSSCQSANGNFDYDVIVVGAGVGGYVCAIKCSQLGLKTMIVEKEYMGGVCLNVGCIPTKTLLKSSSIYDEIVNEAKNFGITVQKTNVKADWSAMQKRKAGVVEKLTTGVSFLMKKNKVDVQKGMAKAIDKNTIEVNGKKFSSANIIVATGSIPNSLNLPGADKAVSEGWLINSTDALSLKTLPKSVVIIGGGVIGVEFASIFQKMGSKVTILQYMPTILEMLDGDVSKEMTKILTEAGNLQIITNVRTKEFKNKSVVYEVDGKESTIKADAVLQSVGRKIVLDGMEALNMSLNERGHVIVNEYQETNVPNVYAIGDITGTMMLAHVASHQGIIAANRIAMKKGLAGAHNQVMNFDRVPSCIYTHPEIGVVGATEEQLKKQGRKYKVGKFPFSVVGKAMADGSTQGFVKLLCDAESFEILGAHIVSKTATDMIAEIVLAMEGECTAYEIANSIHPHPTFSEAIGEAAEMVVSGKAINM